MTDPDSRYAIIAIGDKQGFYIETTYDDLPKINLNFDSPTNKIPYQIDGNISGVSSVELFIGNMFQFFSGSSYNWSLDRDENKKDDPVDFVAKGINTVNYYKIKRNIILMPMETFNLSFDASDKGEDVDVGLGKIYKDLSYLGTSAYLLTPKLSWVFLGSDSFNPTFSFQKFPESIRHDNDIYSIGASFSAPNLWKEYTVYSTNPESTIVLGDIPNDISGAQKSSDEDHVVKATLDDPHSSGIESLDVNFLMGETFSAKNNWSFFKTRGRIDNDWSVGFPTKATKTGDISSDWLPKLDDYVGIASFSTNMDTQSALKTHFCSSTDNMDGLITALVRYNF